MLSLWLILSLARLGLRLSLILCLVLSLVLALQFVLLKIELSDQLRVSVVADLLSKFLVQSAYEPVCYSIHLITVEERSLLL